MKKLNIRIWALSAALMISFACVYSQQSGSPKEAKLKEEKENRENKADISKKEALKEIRENKQSNIKEETKDKVQPTKQKEKKDFSEQREKPKKAQSASDTLCGKRHAYGKDKGSLEGKEFGQNRAEQAKLKKEWNKNELKRAVGCGEYKISAAKEKIETAKEELEKDKKARKISEREYQLMKDKIAQAEKAVGELESKVQAGRQMLIQ